MDCKHLCLIIILISFITPVLANQGQTILYAVGDQMSIIGYDAPLQIIIPNAGTLSSNEIACITENSLSRSYNGTLWVFCDNQVLTYPFVTDGSSYNITVPSYILSKLKTRVYTYSLQFAGMDQRMDVIYDPNLQEIGTNIRSIPNISTAGLSGDVIYQKFITYRSDNYVEDVYLDGQIDAEAPSIKLTDIYDLGNGDLYVGGTTDLSFNQTITGIINGDMPATSTLPYYNNMIRTSGVYGTNSSQPRVWSFEFPQNLTGLLPVGQNDVYVSYLGNGYTTVPFTILDTSVTPTPTPTPVPIYSVTGNLVGFQGVNTVNPNPTVTPTPTPTINIDRNVTPLGNRTIHQMDNVYVGETNVNILDAIGWADPISNAYTIQYCGGYPPYVADIATPKSYYFDPSIYANRLGEWCQYEPSENPAQDPYIEAFNVLADPINTTPQSTLSNITTTSNHSSPIPTSTLSTNVGVTPTPVTYNQTGVALTPTETINPYPTNSVILPLPIWIPIISLITVSYILIRSRKYE